jgi:hypothetical protein
MYVYMYIYIIYIYIYICIYIIYIYMYTYICIYKYISGMPLTVDDMYAFGEQSLYLIKVSHL